MSAWRPIVMALFLLAPPRLAAQTDSTAIVGTLRRMLTAMYTKDQGAFRAEMDSAARMTLLRPRQGGGVRVLVLSVDQFVLAAMAPDGTPLEEPVRIQAMNVEGDLATVWAEYQVRANGVVSHCGHDAFHLVRREGSWRVLTVADTFRREGCGPVWTSATIDPSAARSGAP